MSSLLQVHSFIHIMVSLPSVNHSKYLSFSYLIWYMENFQDFYSVCSGWEQILKRCSHNRNKKHYENIITKQNGKIITEQKESLIFVPRILLYLILNGFDCLYVRISIFAHGVQEIIQMDLKTNKMILLDKHMRAMFSDFSLSKLAVDRAFHVSGILFMAQLDIWSPSKLDAYLTPKNTSHIFILWLKYCYYSDGKMYITLELMSGVGVEAISNEHFRVDYTRYITNLSFFIF